MTTPRFIIALLGLNMLMTLGTGLLSYSLLRSSNSPAADQNYRSGAAWASHGNNFYTVEKIIFNLQEGKREHYFVLDLALQSDLTLNHDQVKKFEPMVRNSVISHLSRMAFGELRALPIADLQTRLEVALFDDFTHKQMPIPFTAVLVSKIIVQ